MREDVGFRLPLSHSSSLKVRGYAMFRMQHGSMNQSRQRKGTAHMQSYWRIVL